MTTTRNANGGLSTADLERIRETLASGRRPKVMFTESAGQIVGQTGQVVQLTDPELSDEWLVVRFGRDELPFSPADLMVPPRNGAATRSRSVAAPTPPQEDPVPSTTTSTTPAAAPAVDADSSAKQATSVKQDISAKQASSAKEGTSNSKTTRNTRSTKAPRQRTPAGLTVTVEYQAGEWTVAAHQGSKVLAKPYLIKPGEALKMVAMLDVPGVQEAVEQLVAAERAEAEQRAEQLRSQLAEVEAQLAELRDAG